MDPDPTPTASTVAPARAASATPITAARRARRDALSVASAIGPLGIALGAAMAESDLSAPLTALTAPLMVAGASQLTLVTQLDLGAPAAAAALASVIVNLRFVVYGAALSSRFAGQPLWFRVLGAHFVVDQTYGLVVTSGIGDDVREFRTYFATAGTLLATAWSASVATGVVAGSVLPDAVPLDLVMPAMFIGMALPQVTNRRELGVAVVAVPVAVTGLPADVSLLVAAAAGAAIGAGSVGASR